MACALLTHGGNEKSTHGRTKAQTADLTANKREVEKVMRDYFEATAAVRGGFWRSSAMPSSRKDPRASGPSFRPAPHFAWVCFTGRRCDSIPRTLRWEAFYQLAAQFAVSSANSAPRIGTVCGDGRAPGRGGASCRMFRGSGGC